MLWLTLRKLKSSSAAGRLGAVSEPEKLADDEEFAAALPFSESGVLMRESGDPWDLPLVARVLPLLPRFSGGRLRRKWGIV